MQLTHLICIQFCCSFTLYSFFEKEFVFHKVFLLPQHTALILCVGEVSLDFYLQGCYGLIIPTVHQRVTIVISTYHGINSIYVHVTSHSACIRYFQFYLSQYLLLKYKNV